MPWNRRIQAGRARSPSILTFLVLLLLLLSSSNCATYWKHRQKDTADVFSAGYQQESYGLSLRFGPAKAGLHYKSDNGLDAGYRQGYVDRFRTQSFVLLVLGSDILEGPVGPEDSDPSRISPEKESEPQSGDPEEIRDTGAPYDSNDRGDTTVDTDRSGEQLSPQQRKQAEAQMQKLLKMDLEEIKQLPQFKSLDPEQQKKFLEQLEKLKKQSESNQETKKALPAAALSEMALRKKTYRARSPLGTSVPFRQKNPLLKPGKNKSVSEGFAPASYLTTIEVKGGLFGGIYFAFHLGEFVDLLVGFAGFDPMNDDGVHSSGLTEEQLSRLTPAEREILDRLSPEQRQQFLNLSPEERERLLRRLENSPRGNGPGP
ncbi:MAG: hypothetical protein KDK23_07960 [Leptospiraceae bacterium]|nr:hypothetical protein [Leptospiraceae bacterium]